MSDIVCPYCFHHCLLKEGSLGCCRARANINGVNVCANYGHITSMALDPIEKKPLKRFYPGSYILSVGSYGCNLSCPFCQNWQISMTNKNTVGYEEMMPEILSEFIMSRPNNLGIAFTYNEPMISFEYIKDVARIVRPKGYKVVLVTNGCVEETVLQELERHVDAMNIDLKGDASYYEELGGSYEQVKHTIEYMHDKCHIEITSLIIPTKNDKEAWIKEEARWLASLNPDIPLHITRYFPNWKYDIKPTPVRTIYRMKKAAEEYLNDVFTGNV